VWLRRRGRTGLQRGRRPRRRQGPHRRRRRCSPTHEPLAPLGTILLNLVTRLGPDLTVRPAMLQAAVEEGEEPSKQGCPCKRRQAHQDPVGTSTCHGLLFSRSNEGSGGKACPGDKQGRALQQRAAPGGRLELTAVARNRRSACEGPGPAPCSALLPAIACTFYKACIDYLSTKAAQTRSETWNAKETSRIQGLSHCRRVESSGIICDGIRSWVGSRRVESRIQAGWTLRWIDRGHLSGVICDGIRSWVDS